MSGQRNDNACLAPRRSRLCCGFSAMLLTGICILSGCSKIAVYSDPAGARVLLNGVDTGRTTPTSIRVRNLPVGRSYISVEKEGYHSLTKKQAVDVRISIGNIVWSWFPPLLIKNLVDNRWKGITYPPRRFLQEFELGETRPPEASSNELPHQP